MNEIIRFTSNSAIARRALRAALVAALSCLVLALGACQSSRSISDRMESKYSLKKRKTSISRLWGQGSRQYALPVRVSPRAYRAMLESIEASKGVKYRYGGTTAEGFDCSGFVQHLYSQAFQLALPRTSTDLALLGVMIKRDQLQRGDLLFFAFDGDIGHVGVYLGDQRFAHASSSKGGVTISRLDNSYAKHFAFGTRIIRVK